MKLSIVIVNYNVRYFLEQCLRSVENAMNKSQHEVFVVDNASVDGSVSMVRNKFPWVKLIAGTKNVGFSAGNNIAIKQAKGEYVLLLNPDTVVEENTLQQVINFMDKKNGAGGLGVKMIDGNGKFLPESKRGLPTPWVAFYKIFGLASLFPKSKRFGKYHLTFLNKEKIHEVDVLSGAFMVLRKSVLDKIGLLDETFFMYGEDIDLSYRITKAGYKNYYFPETTIIHYKGESTKKHSLNYVFVFYNAMLIFAKKHFSQKYAAAYSLLIRMAVLFTAALAVSRRIFNTIIYPLIDIIVLWLGFIVLTPFWEQIRYKTDNWFPDYYLTNVVPFYIVVWLISLIYTGTYDKPYKQKNSLKGLGWGTLILLVGYGLLPEELRFSRMMLIFGAIWAGLLLPLLRIVYSKLKLRGFKKRTTTRAILIGSAEEIKKTEPLLKNRNREYYFVGHVQTDQEHDPRSLGHVSDVDEIVRINHVNEIIFSAQSLTARHTIRLMAKLSEPGMAFKIASPDGVSIIGSTAIDGVGNLYSVEVNAISSPKNKRFKRTFDILTAIFIITTYPVTLFTVKNKNGLFINAIKVLSGQLSWVGFTKTDRLHELPVLKNGVLTPASIYPKNDLTPSLTQKLNVLYAKDYHVLTDLTIVFRCRKQLGE